MDVMENQRVWYKEAKFGACWLFIMWTTLPPIERVAPSSLPVVDIVCVLARFVLIDQVLHHLPRLVELFQSTLEQRPLPVGL